VTTKIQTPGGGKFGEKREKIGGSSPFLWEALNELSKKRITAIERNEQFLKQHPTPWRKRGKKNLRKGGKTPGRGHAPVQKSFKANSRGNEDQGARKCEKKGGGED